MKEIWDFINHLYLRNRKVRNVNIKSHDNWYDVDVIFNNDIIYIRISIEYNLISEPTYKLERFSLNGLRYLDRETEISLLLKFFKPLIREFKIDEIQG